MSWAASGLPARASHPAGMALFVRRPMRFGQPGREPAGDAEDYRHAAPESAAHQMPGAAATMDPGESPSGRDELAVRAGRHVAAGQRGGKHIRSGSRLQAQDIGEPAFADLDKGTAVMGDQPGQHGVGAPGPVHKVVTTPLTDEADHDDGQVSLFDAHQEAGDTSRGPGLTAPSQRA